MKPKSSVMFFVLFLFCSFSIADAAPAITDHLMAYYSFDENLNDSTGNGFDGVYFGAGSPNYIDGQLGKAIDLPGGANGIESNPQIVLSNSNGFKFSNQSFSINMLVKIKSNPDYYQDLFVIRNSTNWAPRFGFAKSRSGHWNGALYTELFQTASTGSQAVGTRTGDALVNAGWMFISSVVDYNRKKIEIYVSGELEASTDLIDFDFTTASNLFVYIGGEQSIDEMTIYSKALIQSDISDLYVSYGSPKPEYNTTVPVPGAFLLLGSGLIGFVGLGRRKFK